MSFSSSSFGIHTPATQAKKRKVFFSFHYDDIMRVNNVRNCGEFKQAGSNGQSSTTQRSIEGFYDLSLWEKRRLDGPEALKRMIREGVQNTSAVCVLIGAQTYARPWVRYEIARSVIDERGLLTVHLNNLNHHVDRRPHPLGLNPLDYMGIYKTQSGYYLAEANSNAQWVSYGNHTSAVTKPSYLPEPISNTVVALSRGTRIYDFARERGHDAIGSWIDAAAQAVGR